MRSEARLSKLEAIVDTESMDLSWMTSDEVTMELLDLSRALGADPAIPIEERERMTQQAADIEDGIQRQALARREPGYAEYLAQVAGTRFPDYVPCICGDLMGYPGSNPRSLEYCDLDKPRIMERRAAILARPDVQALLAYVDVAASHA